jgi:hypothetical protein
MVGAGCDSCIRACGSKSSWRRRRRSGNWLWCASDDRASSKSPGAPVKRLTTVQILVLLGAVFAASLVIALRQAGGDKSDPTGSTDRVSGQPSKPLELSGDPEFFPDAAGQELDQGDPTVQRSESDGLYEITITFSGDAEHGTCNGRLEVFSCTDVEAKTAPILIASISARTITANIPEENKRVMIVAAVSGYFTVSRILDLSQRAEQITIPLHFAERIVCRVVTESMQPIGDARVRCSTAALDGESVGAEERAIAHFAAAEGTTNARGQVFFDTFPEGPIRLHAIPPPPLAEAILWNCEPGIEQVIICRSALEIWGRVTEAEGSPIPDVNIAAYGPFPMGGEVPLAATRSDENGDFRLAGVPDGPEYIRCYAEKAGWSLGHRLLQKDSDARTSPIEFVLAPASKLRIAVYAWDGAPVPGLRLRLVGELGAGVPFVYQTDELGVAVIENYVVANLRYQLLAVIGSSEVLLGEIETPSEEQWPAEPLPFTASELGRVLLGPVKNQEVQSLELEWLEGASSRLAINKNPPDCIYLPARNYSAAAEIGGRVHYSALVVEPSSELRLTWPNLTAQRLLVAQSVSDGSWPVVTVYSDSNVLIDQLVVSAEEASCELAAGRYYFSLDYRGTVVDSTLYDISLQGTTIDLRHLLKPSSGEIHGTVVSESGKGLPGVAVTATAEDGYRLPRVLAGASGEFTLLSVPFGRYWITADVGDLVGANPCRVAAVVHVGSPDTKQEVELKVPSEYVMVDFEVLPGAFFEGLVCGGGSSTDAELLPGGMLRAPAIMDAEWAVVTSRGTDGGIHIGGVPLRDQRSPLRYTADEGTVQIASFLRTPNGECHSDEVHLRVQGHPLGIAARLDSDDEIDLHWTTGLPITAEVRHSNGRREVIALRQSGDHELRCSGQTSAIWVDFEPNRFVRALDLWIECCGVRTSINERRSIELYCDADEHRAVLSGHGVYHSLVTVMHGDVLRPRSQAGKVVLSSSGGWRSVDVIIADNPEERYPLEWVNAHVWVGVGLPADDYIIVATPSTGTPSPRGTFTAHAGVDIELAFD